MADSGDQGGGLAALHRLQSADPPLFLTSNPDLSLSARVASRYLFDSLKPYTPKSPFDQLLTEGFDAEQIWQQIDLQSQPLTSSLLRQIKRFEKDPAVISKAFDIIHENGALENGVGEDGEVGLEEGPEGLDGGVDLELSDDEDEEKECEEESEDEDEDGGEEEEEEEEDDDDDKGTLVDDKFLKIKELEKYLQEDEEREYGVGKKKKKEAVKVKEAESDEEGEDDDDEDEDEDELELYGKDDEDDRENARYEDFFVSNKKTSKKPERANTLDAFDSEGEDRNTSMQMLSKHEKEQQKIQAKIAEMEKANLDEKVWTMQGEVTAAKRPKDSAIAADLDFELNVRPPPVITEEVTASIEEIIKKRIAEGHFDDVEKVQKLPTRAPREVKELDENKSKKGLAELYEEDYLQKTGLASAPLSFNDELKKEASTLFKSICLKLDALSHFHFAPKPVIEDMSVETNLPALAMEEVAPVAVSDAAMLAPEEVFAGKGDVKEAAELTKEEKKRRRAKKKRKFKAEQEKRHAKKPREISLLNQDNDKDQSQNVVTAEQNRRNAKKPRD